MLSHHASKESLEKRRIGREEGQMFETGMFG
jgi:hypothetical protein